ncbi:MAG: cytidylate kinase-like family protein [Acidobacteriaceae bacterium]|nr:cytidylate kinase-like family protein [Acidobacteriaceae bacterium]
MNVITIEREYGSGAPAIAEELSRRLGWTLWDRELTCEIARRLKCDTAAVEKREERFDPIYYRLLKTFMRGSNERAFSGGQIELLDAEHLSQLFERVIVEVASRGRCIIVGRAAPWFLRDRQDAFHVFVYGSRDDKIRRLMSQGKRRDEAEDLVDNVDQERAAFIRKYYGKTWPQRDLYHLMINSKVGTPVVVNLILSEMEALSRPQQLSA